MWSGGRWPPKTGRPGFGWLTGWRRLGPRQCHGERPQQLSAGVHFADEGPARGRLRVRFAEDFDYEFPELTSEDQAWIAEQQAWRREQEDAWREAEQ